MDLIHDAIKSLALRRLSSEVEPVKAETVRTAAKAAAKKVPEKPKPKPVPKAPADTKPPKQKVPPEVGENPSPETLKASQHVQKRCKGKQPGPVPDELEAVKQARSCNAQSLCSVKRCAW